MKTAMFLVFCALAGVAFCDQSHSAKLNVTAAAMEYMLEHYYSPQSKTETTNGLEPTDVWCFSDKGTMRSIGQVGMSDLLESLTVVPVYINPTPSHLIMFLLYTSRCCQENIST